MIEDVSLGVWALLIAAVLVTETIARTRARRFPSIADLVHPLLQPRVTRWLVYAGWLWLGWHVFVRVDWQ